MWWLTITSFSSFVFSTKANERLLKEIHLKHSGLSKIKGITNEKVDNNILNAVARYQCNDTLKVFSNKKPRSYTTTNFNQHPYFAPIYEARDDKGKHSKNFRTF